MKEGFSTADLSIGKHDNASKTPEITEQEEMPRIFEALRKYYWQRERIGIDQPFTHTLDKIEVFEALSNTRPQTLEEAQSIVARYHSNWQKIGEITHLSQESFNEKGLADLMIHQETARQYVRCISEAWYSACLEYRFRNDRLRGGRYMSFEEEFGIDIFNVDTFLAQPQEDREQLFIQYPELNEMRRRFHLDEMQVLKDTQRKIKEAIHRLVKEKPEIIRDLIIKLQNSEEPINDLALDDVFGIKTEEAERNTNYIQLREQYPNEEFWQGGGDTCWTTYELIRTMVRELNMNDSDVLYDLGSGFGRVPIYTSLATGAQCKGIEIVPQRVAESIAVKNNLNIDNLEFVQGNVLEQDYRDGTVFFLFNPFTRQTLEAVNEKLRQLAQTKNIKVVSLGPSTNFFNRQDWLKPTEANEHSWNLKIYESQ